MLANKDLAKLIFNQDLEYFQDKEKPNLKREINRTKEEKIFTQLKQQDFKEIQKATKEGK